MLVSLVDDDPRFRKHVEKWAQQKDLNHLIELKVFDDPDSLLAFLRTSARRSSRKMLVLLDLDFHGDKETGLRALAKLKKRRSSLRKIPVIIYTNSRDATEVDKSYLQYANSFVWKGHGGRQKKRFTELVVFWQSITALPAFGASHAA